MNLKLTKMKNIIIASTSTIHGSGYLEYILDELKSFFNELGYQKFRADQVFQWMYQKNVASVDEMTNLSKQQREELK